MLVLDFDGVIYRGTEPYPQIPHLIAKLSESYILTIASFNTQAMTILNQIGLAKYFRAWRCGTRNEKSSQEDNPTGSVKTKADQIVSMAREMNVSLDDICFFDDWDINIQITRDVVKSVLVDNRRGLTSADIYGNQ